MYVSYFGYEQVSCLILQSNTNIDKSQIIILCLSIKLSGFDCPQREASSLQRAGGCTSGGN